MTSFAAWVLIQDPSKLKLADVVLRLGGLLSVYLAFTLAQRFLSHKYVFRIVELQLNLFVLAMLLLAFFAPVLEALSPYVGDAVKAMAVFLCITIGLKLFDLLVFDRLVQWRKKPPVPLVLRDLGRLGAALVALVLIVRGFFPGVNLNVLAVSSLVVGYIVGNATQDTLGNLFAGLALNAERPFQIGDWVTVGGHTGVLIDTTWRATRLCTKANDYIVVPNSAIAKEFIINYSRPSLHHACYLNVGVSYDTPPNKARGTILAVLREAPDVSRDFAPAVYLSGYGDSAINFTIKFFIVDFARSDPIQSEVMDRLWYAFRREGISIPFPIRDVRYREALADDQAKHAASQIAIRELLAGVELFQSLSSEEMGRLVDATKLMLFAGGENLCRQGEPGDSFYIIREGSVAVLVNAANGQSITAAHLARGAFFGEMSLLTGEPRSGTVRAETDVEVLSLSKQDFAGLLQANVDLAGKLASVLEKRNESRRAAMSSSIARESAPETRSLLAARIRQFFGIG